MNTHTHEEIELGKLTYFIVMMFFGVPSLALFFNGFYETVSFGVAILMSLPIVSSAYILSVLINEENPFKFKRIVTVHESNQLHNMFTNMNEDGVTEQMQEQTRPKSNTDVSDQVSKDPESENVLISGNGLFKKNIPKIKTPSLAEQMNLIENLGYVIRSDFEKNEFVINVIGKDVCKIHITDPPIVDTFNKKGSLCLGNALSQYKTQLDRNNIYECIRLIYKAYDSGGTIS